jgi:hypothetical protein
MYNKSLPPKSADHLAGHFATMADVADAPCNRAVAPG